MGALLSPNDQEEALSRAYVAAVAAGAGLIDQSDNLEIGVTWSQIRPTPEPSKNVAFSKVESEALREAARIFRDKQPREGVTIFGWVRTLKRDVDVDNGVITVKADIDNRTQSVTADLDLPNYNSAIRAHTNKEPVVLDGDVDAAVDIGKKAFASLKMADISMRSFSSALYKSIIDGAQHE